MRRMISPIKPLHIVMARAKGQSCYHPLLLAVDKRTADRTSKALAIGTTRYEDAYVTTLHAPFDIGEVPGLRAALAQLDLENLKKVGGRT